MNLANGASEAFGDQLIGTDLSSGFQTEESGCNSLHLMKCGKLVIVAVQDNFSILSDEIEDL